MAGDILESVRNEILKEDEKSLPWVPKSLDQTWETQAGIAAALAGAAAGFALGAHMGLAGPWGAIAGTIPMTIAGGVIGYFSGAKVGSKVQRDWSGFGSGSGTDSTRRIASSSSEQGPPVKTVQSSSNIRTISSTTRNATHCGICGADKSRWWDAEKDACIGCGLKSGRDSSPLANKGAEKSYCINCKMKYHLKHGTSCPKCDTNLRPV